MAKIRAVIFDMDGVLVDAREWHYEALNKALTLFGFPVSRFDHLVTFDGLPTRRKLEMLTREKGLPAGLHPFINELKQIYTLEIVYARCKPTFAHEYALSRLQAEGYRLALASNSVRATIDLVLQKCGLASYLEFIVSNQDVLAAKPEPEIYTTTIGRLGLSPSECLVVEDNDYGVRAAEAAGANVLVVHGTDEVTYENVMARIRGLEEGGSC
jgi:beta-phosphoglucomutase